MRGAEICSRGRGNGNGTGFLAFLTGIPGVALDARDALEEVCSGGRREEDGGEGCLVTDKLRVLAGDACVGLLAYN